MMRGCTHHDITSSDLQVLGVGGCERCVSGRVGSDLRAFKHPVGHIRCVAASSQHEVAGLKERSPWPAAAPAPRRPASRCSSIGELLASAAAPPSRSLCVCMGVLVGGRQGSSMTALVASCFMPRRRFRRADCRRHRTVACLRTCHSQLPSYACHRRKTWSFRLLRGRPRSTLLYCAAARHRRPLGFSAQATSGELVVGGATASLQQPLRALASRHCQRPASYGLCACWKCRRTLEATTHHTTPQPVQLHTKAQLMNVWGWARI